jgi:hypothetical protein
MDMDGLMECQRWIIEYNEMYYDEISYVDVGFDMKCVDHLGICDRYKPYPKRDEEGT